MKFHVWYCIQIFNWIHWNCFAIVSREDFRGIFDVLSMIGSGTQAQSTENCFRSSQFSVERLQLPRTEINFPSKVKHFKSPLENCHKLQLNRRMKNSQISNFGFPFSAEDFSSSRFASVYEWNAKIMHREEEWRRLIKVVLAGDKNQKVHLTDPLKVHLKPEEIIKYKSDCFQLAIVQLDRSCEEIFRVSQPYTPASTIWTRVSVLAFSSPLMSMDIFSLQIFSDKRH